MRIFVNLTAVDGELLERFLVESNPAVGTSPELATQVRDMIEHRFNVIDESDDMVLNMPYIKEEQP